MGEAHRISDFDHAVVLMRQGPQWSRAVFGLRMAFIAITFAVVGILLHSVAGGPFLYMTAVGMIVYLVALVIVLSGMLPGYFSLEKPRPRFWNMRMALVKDCFRSRLRRGDVSSRD